MGSMTWRAPGRSGVTVPGPGQRRVIAVDGKTLRGSGAAGEALASICWLPVTMHRRRCDHLRVSVALP